MGETTSIAWTNATANTAFGCRKVDLACKNCYMFRIQERRGISGTTIQRFDIDNVSRRIASFRESKRLIFLNDMTDTFGEFNSDEEILRIHESIIETNDDREFQLLTKRIGRAMVFYRKYYEGKAPPNVWLGCSIGERSRLRRLEQLREITAKIRFVSFEPLIEDLGEFSLQGIQWVIVGGESGNYKKKPREMKPQWAERILEIARRDGAKFFFKQMGGIGGDGVGGNLLNGRQIQEMPT